MSGSINDDALVTFTAVTDIKQLISIYKYKD